MVKQLPIFSLSNATFDYRQNSDKPILSVPKFEAFSGSVIGLLGGNGAGKTTFIKGISGLLKYSGIGVMRLNGVAVTPEELRFKRARITVFTEDHSFENWTFNRYLQFVTEAYGIKVRGNLKELVTGFNFADFVDKRMGDLSSGNAKKARLIAALAIRPQILILDEPVDALDFLGTEYLYKSIGHLRKCGSCVIMSSHVAESLIQLSDSLYLLQHGTMMGPYDVPETREALAALMEENSSTSGR